MSRLTCSISADDASLSGRGGDLGRGSGAAPRDEQQRAARAHGDEPSPSDTRGAAREQRFKLDASGVISAFGGGSAERALYRDFPLTKGFDYGPPRLPKAPFDESRYAELRARLEAIGFWKQLGDRA